MTDREPSFSEALDYTPANSKDKHASHGGHWSPEPPRHGAPPNCLPAAAAQLVEAACRAHEGDREAAKVHIAQAVALLQRTSSLEPSATRVPSTAKRQANVEGLLTRQTTRPFPHIDANVALGEGRGCKPIGSYSQHLDRVRLHRVLSYISNNIDDDITLADLAGIAGYSPFHFARKFTVAVGVSPRRYVTCMRLRRALVELTAAKLPLAQIALNAHFSCQASFTRAFHRAVGLTPKAYQRQALTPEVSISGANGRGPPTAIAMTKQKLAGV